MTKLTKQQINQLIEKEEKKAKRKAQEILQKINTVEEFLDVVTKKETILVDGKFYRDGTYKQYAIDLSNAKVRNIKYYKLRHGYTGYIFQDGTSCISTNNGLKKTISIIGNKKQGSVFQVI